MIEVKINTDFIKLDSFFKIYWCLFIRIRGQIFIKNGEVKVNGEIEVQRGKKLY